MDYFIQNPENKLVLENLKHERKRLTQEQVNLLETTFTATKKLDPALKLDLSSRLGVPARQIAVWYQNKSARFKTQKLELNYNTIQLKLQEALADKRKLERKVKELQEDLKRCQDSPMAMKQKDCCMVNCYGELKCCCNCSVIKCRRVSDGDDQDGQSSGVRDDGKSVIDGRALQFDELSACLFKVTSGSSSSSWV